MNTEYDKYSARGGDASGEVGAGGGGGGGGGSGGTNNCKPGWQDCNNDTICDSDTNTDPKNCGACAHACVDGSCQAGMCQPVAIASGKGIEALALLSGEEFLYFVSKTDGTVSRHLKTPSGGVDVIASSIDRPKVIAIDGANVYWGAENGTIESIDKVPGKVSKTLQTQQDLVAIAVDALSIYWTNRKVTGPPAKQAEIRKSSRTGGAVTVLATDTASPTDIAVFGSEVFWISYQGEAVPGKVMKVSTGGGPASEFATGLAEPDSIAVDGSYVYVCETGLPANSWKDGIISRYSKADGKKEVLAQPVPYPTSIAISPDSTSVYWSAANNMTMMGLLIQPLGKPITIAGGQSVAKSVTVDDKCVYWTSADQILKVAR
jgi:hypothetical protein